MIATLLLIMVLLAVIMVVTAQVTLSTRRSSADQQTLLSARYAAESGMSRVQARLRAMKTLLDSASIPPTIGNSVVEGYIKSLCGVNILPAAPPTGETVVCTFPAQGLNSDSSINPRVSLFNAAIPNKKFNDLGFTTPESRTRFWGEMFSGTQGVTYTDADGTYSAQFGLVPTELVRTGNGFRLRFKIPNLTVQGQNGPTTQFLSARSKIQGDAEYYLLISREPFAKYALLTNHHFQSAQAEQNGTRINYTSRTLFSGPVHTNQRFLFHEEPIFWGEVTSAGCPERQIGIVNGKPDCLVSPDHGAFFGSATEHFMSTAEMSSAQDSSINAPVYQNNKPKFNATVTWDAQFVPLPDNSRDQWCIAKAGQLVGGVCAIPAVSATTGLALTGNVESMSLYREVIAGQERQRVTYTQGGVTTQLSYGADGKLFLLQNGVWVTAGRDVNGNIVPSATQVTFNGVIAVRGPVDANGNEISKGGIANVNGGPNVAQSGPAGASIASFAGLTVAASGDMNITSSLKYTDPPCEGVNTPTAPATCDNLGAQNILGIYSSGGNVNLISPNNTSGIQANLGVDPQIHAVLMASQGAVQVDGWNQGAADNSLGKVNLIGGIIENYYGAFGTVSGTGYGRNFVYDRRTYDGFAPPAFPTQKDWTIGLRVLADDKLPDASRGIELQGDAVSTRRN